MLDYPEQYEAFAEDLRFLMSSYETTGSIATIVRAVAEAARMGQGR